MMKVRFRCKPACIAIVLVTASSAAAPASSPPIDCRHARSTVDRSICESPEDVAIDREVTALYDRGFATFRAEERHQLAQSQRAYLHKRDGCAWAAHNSAHPGTAIEECVRAAMDGRLRSLRAAVDRGTLQSSER